MQISKAKFAIIALFTYVFCSAVLLNCSKNTTGNDDDLNLNPFKTLAREEVCAKSRNNLYLIDKHLVFWERKGECGDNSFAQILYGDSPEEIKCMYNDSIAGPVYACYDSTYHEMFQTMISNLDGDNLGLNSEHTVEDVLF